MDIKGKDYLNEENALRSKEFAKNSLTEDYYLRLNEHLQIFETEQDAFQSESDLPLVLVVGLPRSGTTLMMQLLSYCLNLGYVNNLMAKFWLAPNIGYKIGQDSTINKQAVFQSNYGKTLDVSSPHEFSYFWINWLKITKTPAYDPSTAAVKIDYEGLSTVIKRLQHQAGTGFMFKGLHPIRHIEKLQQKFRKILVVRVLRNPIEVAHSLKNARIKYYGNPNSWWSLITPNYDELKELPYHLQIPLQMKTLQDDFERNLQLLPKENQIDVKLEDMLSILRGLLNK